MCLRSQSFESAAMATSRMQEAQARRGNDGVRSGEGFAPGASPTGVSREQPSMAAAAAAATSAAAESPPPGAPARATHAAAPEDGRPPPGAPAGASGEEEQTWMNDRQILYARELRQRFALPGGPMLLNPRMVGFDTSNRDGIPINGFRCDKLLADIEAMAFDPDEANHDNVCIEARPGTYELVDYNRAVCKSQEFLANVDVEVMGYGSASHSHLHQCLKNILGGAKCSENIRQFAVGGRLSFESVQRADPLLAAACVSGLKWQVLSWRIRDVPGAIEVIQAACNRKNSASMKETEMQAIARLSAICTSLNRRASGVTFADAQEAMRKSMPEVADSAEFVGLLRFVVNVGADNAPFIADLKEFVGIRGEDRHVRANLFVAVSKLPVTCPHLMIACIVTAYSAPAAFFNDGYSRFIGSGDIAHLLHSGPSSSGSRTSGPQATQAALEAEAILRYFHRAQVFKKVPNDKRLDFLCSLDTCVGRLLLEKDLGKMAEACPDLPHLAEKFFRDCVALCGISGTQMPEKVWTPPSGVGGMGMGRGARSRASGVELQPKIIEFDEKGEAKTRQDVREEKVEVEDVAFAKTLESEALSVEVQKAKVLCALHSMHGRLPNGPEFVCVSRDTTGTTAVTAARDLVAKELCLLPLVASANFILQKKAGMSFHPHAVDIGEFKVSPSVRMPPKNEKVDETRKPTFIPPFWLVARTHMREEANCELVEVTARDATGLSLGSLDLGTKMLMVHHEAVVVPAITNSVALPKGTTLVLYAPARVAPPKESKTKRWEDVATATKKKRTA